MANLVNSQQASSKLFISCLIVLVLSASCLSPYYSRAQQLVVGLQQRGIEFIVDSPVLAATSPLFPHELFTSLLFSYVRWKDVSGPPDVLLVYTVPNMDQADYAESRIRDFAQAFYGLRGVDLPPGSVQYYQCDETIVVYGAFGQRSLDPAVDKAFTDMCGPEFVRYPLENNSRLYPKNVKRDQLTARFTFSVSPALGAPTLLVSSAQCFASLLLVVLQQEVDPVTSSFRPTNVIAPISDRPARLNGAKGGGASLSPPRRKPGCC